MYRCLDIWEKAGKTVKRKRNRQDLESLSAIKKIAGWLFLSLIVNKSEQKVYYSTH